MSRRTRATSRKDLGTSRKTLEIEERAREASPLVQELGRKLARTSRELYDLCCKTLPCCGIIRRARFGPSQASCPELGSCGRPLQLRHSRSDSVAGGLGFAR